MHPVHLPGGTLVSISQHSYVEEQSSKTVIIQCATILVRFELHVSAVVKEPVFTYVPLLTRQYKLLMANSSHTLKLGR